MQMPRRFYRLPDQWQLRKWRIMVEFSGLFFAPSEFLGLVDLLPGLVGVMTNARNEYVERRTITGSAASIRPSVTQYSVSEVRDEDECEGIGGWWLFVFVVGLAWFNI
ncbi:hypothetical protein OCU04_009999 [Sclerotinia nivalis]|uniref:Uncharacterized protein n=1 Tax=Sclerotinia nivalis TaxID=352851 RepID=A0A9X0DFH2_9HELO|nr:hypothetical protein OCU04_009999 [Sclerotinia nivalis]